MSQTFNLVCHEKRKKIWISQGWGSMTNFYSGMPERMEQLKAFLNETRGCPLVMLCDDSDWGEWQDYDAADESALANTLKNKKTQKQHDSTLLLREVMAYRRGQGKYNFSRLPDDERSMASLEAWESLETRIEAHLSNTQAGPRGN